MSEQRVSKTSDNFYCCTGPKHAYDCPNVRRGYIPPSNVAPVPSGNQDEREREIRERQDSRRGFQYHGDIEYLLSLLDAERKRVQCPRCNCCNDLAQIAAEFADAERYGRTAEAEAHRARGMEILAKHINAISYEQDAPSDGPTGRCCNNGNFEDQHECQKQPSPAVAPSGAREWWDGQKKYVWPGSRETLFAILDAYADSLTAPLREQLDEARAQREWLIKECGRIGVTVNVAIGAPITEAYRLVNERAEAAERELTQAKSERDKYLKEVGEWRDTLDMYRRAWLRELGGTIRAKSHEIDGFVITTRDLRQKAERLERERDEMFAENKKLRAALRGKEESNG